MIERIGDIVRTVREREKLSLQALADRSGVPLSILEALERGQQGITTVQLDDVAQVLSLDPVALLQEHEVQRPVPSVFLLHAPMQDFDERDMPILDDALEQGRSLTSLRRLLEEPDLALQAGTFIRREARADGKGAPAQDGYQLAREVRQWLGNTGEPIGDVRALLEERFGVAVVVRRFVSSRVIEAESSHATAAQSSRVTVAGIRANSDAVVVLNADDPQRAKNPLLERVHLPHELCHALFDPSQGGLHIVIEWDADPKSNAAEQRARAAEQRARAFAAELLLPLKGLTQLLGPPKAVTSTNLARNLVAQARSRFGTPYHIAVNHLCNLGFIDMQLHGWLKAEPIPPFTGTPPRTTLPESGESSLLVRDLVERAHRDSILMDTEARSLLGMDRFAPLPWDEDEQ